MVTNNKKKTLEKINEFSVKHQLEWGEDKCKVMEIGKHKEKRTQWKLGDKTIENCQNYKYLGEVISRDGKNGANIKERIGKVKAAVIQGMTYARSRIMQKIGTNVTLRFHESNIVPTLLYGCETWTLDSKEASLIERINLWALKKLFGLPPTTPTPAVRYVTGTLFTDIHIKKIQLIYLQSLLHKENDYLAKDSLFTLKENKNGWAKNISRTLEQWGLEQDWSRIAAVSKPAWKREVEKAAENQNKNKLMEECQARSRGTSRVKTKTKSIVEKLQSDNYKRVPLPLIRNLTSMQTRALIMGRYGMLDCKNNYAMKYGSKMCLDCDTVDDETHRINDCTKYRGVDGSEGREGINFEMIYSDSMCEAITVINTILSVWDLEHGKNTIKSV